MRKMLRALRFRKLITEVYTKRFNKYGRQPSGIYWSDEQRQCSRFKIILDQVAAIIPQGSVSIADVGCGYGALADYLRNSGDSDHVRYHYAGYDINPALINACRGTHGIPATQFKLGDCPTETVDFSVMSGTYNMAVTRDVAHWESYILSCLSSCWRYSNRGMVFNLLASDNSYISEGMLYHSNLFNIRRYCRANFGPTRIIREPRLPSDATLVVSR